MSYDRYRQAQIADGQLFQDFVVDVLFEHLGLAVVQYTSRPYQQAVGESRTGVEIKHDKRYRQTGNLYIETAEKAVPRPGPYAPSGIFRDDNSWLYVIGDYDVLFVFAKRLLRALAASGRYRAVELATGTSRGFLVPDAEARKYAAAVLAPQGEPTVLKLAGDLRAVAAELHKGLRAPAGQGCPFPPAQPDREETPPRSAEVY